MMKTARGRWTARTSAGARARRAPAIRPHAVTGEPRGRIVVISANAGGGHDGATDELARRLRRRGFQVDCLNLFDIFPWRLGRLINGAYRGLLTRAPWAYDVLFRIGGTRRAAAPITRALLRPMRPRLRRLLPPDTQAVVSTYPLASQILGPLRSEGQLSVPVITYLTDIGVHPIWISPGVDLYCAMHDASRAQALALGASDVRVVVPLVPPGFRPASDWAKRRARQRLGLPLEGRLALLVAGSRGVGKIEDSAAEVAGTGAATPVVVCGRNAPLYRRLRPRGGYVLGWVDDMPALLHAADVLVENSGGLTAVEALACGVPVATYRPIAGHGKANAATLADAQLTSWIQTPEALEPTLAELLAGTRGRRQRAAGLSLPGPDPATVIADAAMSGAPSAAQVAFLVPAAPDEAGVDPSDQPTDRVERAAG